MSKRRHGDGADVSGQEPPSSAASKKVRFEERQKPGNTRWEGDDGDEYDNGFEEFDHEASLEQRRERKGKVNLDGYRTGDVSSDEETYGRNTSRAKRSGRIKEERPSPVEDEDDMFAENGSKFKCQPGAEDQEELDDEEYCRLKHNPRYLAEGDIAGQDYASRAEFDEKGEQVLEAFNLKEELEEGRFDSEGNYVRKAADPQRFHDKWLHGMDKRDFERAKLAQQRAEEAVRRREAEAEKDPLSSMTKEEVLAAMLKLMKPRETVPRTLRRLGGGKDMRKTKPRWGQRNGGKMDKKPISDVGAASKGKEGGDEEEEEESRRRAVENFTALVDRVVALGDLAVYGETFESLSYRLHGSSGQAPFTAQSSDTLQNEPQWEYKWDATEGSQVFGPYPASQMAAWANQGFFGDETLVRRRSQGVGHEKQTNADHQGNFVPVSQISYSFW